MNINSRRGTKQSAARHHSHLDRCIQLFLLSTAAIIVIAYYYFISSTVLQSTAATNNNNGDDKHHDNDELRNHNIRGGTNEVTTTNMKKAKATIGYAITVSGCPKTNASGMLDGAAVLKHSIHLNSIHSSSSQYDYQMYALVHPSAESCATLQLAPLGYQILVRDVPVPLQEIEGDYLRNKVPKNGCCGDKEFVKLHAYTLMEHPVVVHLDLDTLVLKPMDALYDVMMDGVTPHTTTKKNKNNGGIDVAFNDPMQQQQPINAFFTRDYNMAHPGMKHAGVQGGFLVLRPSMEVYEEFREIIRKGDFRQNGGWGGMGFGPFYGSMTFQGIIPYFYDYLHPGTGVELDPCTYNNMAHNPRDKPTRNDVVSGNCRNGYNRPELNDECEDCRSRPIEEIFTTHFTLCQKPWECHAQDGDRIQERLCRKFHGEWYRVREDLETSMWKRGVVDLADTDEMTKVRGGRFQPQQFRGFCKGPGANGYIPITLPESGVLAKAT
uniref:Nucleotide-diphospho-sugar transferase domain-containing protein n=1 Tax=Skeletonema marinoi TaxID=267567 RepID=A0A7S2Q4C4_9STRA|mmetsp:Transcript_9282/g.15787  ORF Transcript_9282/g.15787 Transcript_9282/m.15787 type:complete len:494 (+) Transcript_9282:211-1692(+)